MTDNYFKVLSIDGGGVRGVIPATILAAIEEQKSGTRTCDLFDLIAGTSIGGVLALALVKPKSQKSQEAEYSAAELIDLFMKQADQIFDKRRLGGIYGPRYKARTIQKLLKRYFGDMSFENALKPVLVTAYELEQRLAMVFYSLHAQTPDDSGHEHRFLMRDLARATSAAPTYYAPARIKSLKNRTRLALVDGGVFANNPAMCAYVEARKFLDKQGDSQRPILVATVGTGQWHPGLAYEKAKSWGYVGWGMHGLNVIFDGVSDNVEYLLGKLCAPGDKVIRLQPQLPSKESAALDNKELENLKVLRKTAEDYIKQEGAEKFAELVSLL